MNDCPKSCHRLLRLLIPFSKTEVRRYPVHLEGGSDTCHCDDRRGHDVFVLLSHIVMRFFPCSLSLTLARTHAEITVLVHCLQLH